MLEYINLLGMKLFVIKEALRKTDPDTASRKPAYHGWSIHQELAVMIYWLRVLGEYLTSLEKGKPDETLYLNGPALSEKAAQHSETTSYVQLIQQFDKISGESVLRLKNCKNKSQKPLSEVIIETLFLCARHYGAIGEKLRMFGQD